MRNNTKFWNKITSISENFVTVVSTILFFILSFISLTLTSQIQLIEHSLVVFRYYWVFAIFLYFILIFFILKNSNKIKENYLFLGFTIAHIIFSIFIIFSITEEMRADASIVRSAAELFSKGDYQYFNHGRYLHYYPHQIGLMYYHILLQKVNSSGYFVFLINSLMVLGINYSILQITKIIGNNNRKKNILIILLSFLFLPQFFFITFGYNLIPGFFFCALSFWMYILHLKTKKYMSLMLSILFMVLSTIIRNNFMIALLAIIFYHLFFETKKKFGIYLLFGFITLSYLINYSIKSYTQNVTKMPLSKGNPKTMWIAMGTKPDNKDINAGWYTTWVTKTMKKNDYDYEKINQIAKKQIKSNFSYFITHPIEMFNYFSEKFFTTWFEPSFQSFWSGPREIYDQTSYNSIVKSIYNKGSLYEVIFTFMKAFLVLIYGLVLYYLLKTKKIKEYFLFLIYFIGGVLFHLIWETKAQYVYPYIFMLLPIVVEVIYSIYKKYTLSNKL